MQQTDKSKLILLTIMLIIILQSFIFLCIGAANLQVSAIRMFMPFFTAIWQLLLCVCLFIFFYFLSLDPKSTAEFRQGFAKTQRIVVMVFGVLAILSAVLSSNLFLAILGACLIVSEVYIMYHLNAKSKSEE